MKVTWSGFLWVLYMLGTQIKDSSRHKRDLRNFWSIIRQINCTFYMKNRPGFPMMTSPWPEIWVCGSRQVPNLWEDNQIRGLLIAIQKYCNTDQNYLLRLALNPGTLKWQLYNPVTMIFFPRRRGRRRRRGETELDGGNGPGLCSAGLPAVRWTHIQHSAQHAHQPRGQGQCSLVRPQMAVIKSWSF